MNLLKSDIVFSFTDFNKQILSQNVYNVVEFAWPVKAWECIANKIENVELDALALTILELLNLQYLSLKQIAEDLGISEDLLVTIIDKELVSKKYCEQDRSTCSNYKTTEKGINYLNGIIERESSDEKIFGYMFQSLIDGDFFPLFFEGKLPDPWRNREELYYLDSDIKQDELFKNTPELISKLSRAYRRYGYVYHKSIEAQKSRDISETIAEIKFVDNDDDIQDLDFDYEDESAEDLSYEAKINDKKAIKQYLKNLKNTRIKLLKTKPKDIYIIFRLYSLKDEPDNFQVVSPFDQNLTKWYTDVFARMRRNENVLFGQCQYGDMKLTETLSSYCKSITNQMYIDIPELKELNPEEYLERTYPELNSCSIKDALKKSYLKLVRQQIFYQNGNDTASDIIMNVYRTLELILNNYINKLDKKKIVDAYFYYVSFETDIDSIKNYFGIKEEISACNTEKNLLNSENKKQNDNSKKQRNNFKSFKRNSLMNNFKNDRFGNSLREKYYFLMYAAYLDDKSNFAKALREDNTIIKKIDDINYKRNSYAGHNDGFDVKKVSKELLLKILDDFKVLSKVLVTNFD